MGPRACYGRWGTSPLSVTLENWYPTCQDLRIIAFIFNVQCFLTKHISNQIYKHYFRKTNITYKSNIPNKSPYLFSSPVLIFSSFVAYWGQIRFWEYLQDLGKGNFDNTHGIINKASLFLLFIFALFFLGETEREIFLCLFFICWRL